MNRNNYIFFVVTIVLYLILCVITVSQIPIFADGTQHVWLVDFVYKNGYVPLTDITGTQPAYFNVPTSIKTNLPFLYQPFYYLLAGYLTQLTRNPEFSVNIINYLSGLFSSIIIFSLCNKIYSKKIVSYIAYLLVLFSNIWFWMFFHRLVEPFVIFLSVLSLWQLFETFKSNTVLNRFIFSLNLAILFSTKMSTIPIIFASLATFVLLNKIKHSMQVLIFSFLLILPVIFFAYKVTNAPIVISTGIKKIDKIFPKAWWNEIRQDWEVNLNNDVNNQRIGDMIYNQYLDIHSAPYKIFRQYGAFGIINEFSLFPLIERNLESFQSKISFSLFTMYRIVFCLGILFFLRQIYEMKNSWNPYFFRFIVFYTICVATIVFFWKSQPEFRYYVYIVPFSVFIFVSPFQYINRNLNNQVRMVFILFATYFVMYNTISEINGIRIYNYTAMYRKVPQESGGLLDSIAFGKSIMTKDNNESPIFTPMKEIAFYSKKRFVWDYRLFFVDDINKLKNYLKYYNFDYVVLPFYSGTNVMANWQYYNGIPSDSSFYTLLNDEEYFIQTEKNFTFTAYKRVGY